MSLSLSGESTTSLSVASLPYTALWIAPLPPATNASAGFVYQEQCVAAQPRDTVPLLGTASGTFTVTGGTAVVGTSRMSGATLSGDFSWLRGATFAHLTFTNLSITAGAGGSVVAVNLTNTIVGQGASGFVWTNGPGTCISQNQSQTADVGGVALQEV